MEAKWVDTGGVKPLSVGGALLAALPFALFGLANIALKISPLQFSRGSSPFWMVLALHPFMIFNWVVLTGLAVGLWARSPRWAFSYLGWGLLCMVWLANLTSYGQPVNWMALPLLFAIALPLVVRRSSQPLETLMNRLFREPTLVAFAIYLFFAALYTTYDENHHPALLWFIGSTGIAAALGAWGYFRAASPIRQALWLLGGMALLAALNLWNGLTWDAAAYYRLPPTASQPLQQVLIMLGYLAVMAVIFLGLGAAAEWLRRRRAARLAK